MDFQSGAVQPVGNVSEGWELIKNDYWLFFAMTLSLVAIIIVIGFALSFVSSLFVNIIGGILGVAGQTAGGDVGNASAIVITQLIGLVINIFTGIIIGTLTGMFTCGIYTALSRKAAGGFPSFSDLIEGFQYFQQALIFATIINILGFIVNLVVLAVSAVTGFTAVSAGLLNPRGGINPAVLGTFLGVIIVIALIYIFFNLLVTACTMFVYPLVVDRKLSAFQAMGLSFKAAMGNLLSIIGLLIIQFFIALGGVLLCFVGILFVMPILSASIFAAYLRVFGQGNTFRPQAPPPPPVFNQQPGY